MLTAFHILAPSNTLQHITEDSECIAAETYDPKPSNSGESVSRRFSENPRTTCPRKDTDWKMAVLTLMTFPFLFCILHFGCALKQSGGPFLPEKYPKTTGSSLKREKRQKQN